MKHTAKNILALLLAGMITLTLVACGDSTYTGDEEDNEVADKNNDSNSSNETVNPGGSNDNENENNGNQGGEDTPAAESQGLAFELTTAGDSYKLVGIGECKDTVVKIPATYEGKPVTIIGSRALAQNSTITRVVIPDGVTTIEGSAFYDCIALESVEIPESVISIGHLAFSGCESLMSIDLPDQVTSLSATFEGCSTLKDVKLPANLTTLGERVFNNCHALESIDIPESVTSIDHEAFIRCESLKAVSFADKYDGWTSEYDYEWYAISDAAAMATLLSDNNGWGLSGVRYKDEQGLIYEMEVHDKEYHWAFLRAEDKTITNAVITDEIGGFPVTAISAMSLMDCKSLISVTIPASATFVDYVVLSGCDNVQSVVFLEPNGWNKSGEPIDLSDPAQNVKILKTLTSSKALFRDE